MTRIRYEPERTPGACSREEREKAAQIMAECADKPIRRLAPCSFVVPVVNSKPRPVPKDDPVYVCGSVIRSDIPVLLSALPKDGSWRTCREIATELNWALSRVGRIAQFATSSVIRSPKPVEGKSYRYRRVDCLCRE